MAAPRQLGFLSACALVIASMIGSGVFTTSGFLLGDLGSPGRVLAVWLAGGVVALMGALCYGALARRFPESGGEYLFLSRTLHPAAGYVAGWVSLLVGFSAPLAAVALAFGQYSLAWLPSGTSSFWSGTFLLVLFTALHAWHVQRGAWLQNLAVLAKVGLVLLFLAWAGVGLRPAHAAPTRPLSLGSLALALVWVSFSYSGWNAAVYIGGEISSPERNLPRAMLFGTVSVALLYLGLNAVFVWAAPIEQLSGKLDIGRVAAEALGGARLAQFTAGLISLALATSLSSMMMAGPRVYARMADDGCLPRWFCFPLRGPPRGAIVLQAALALAMLWSATFESLLTYIGFTLGLCAAAAVAGLIRLRLREGPASTVPGWPWLPAMFVLVVVAISLLTAMRKPWQSALGLATLLAGGSAWYFARAKR